MTQKVKERLDETDDARTYKMVKREIDLSCSFCPPHQFENAGRKPKYGTRKSRKKNKR